MDIAKSWLGELIDDKGRDDVDKDLQTDRDAAAAQELIGGGNVRHRALRVSLATQN